MRIGPGSIACLLGAGLTFVVSPAHPNGRTPPRPSEGSVVKAVCEERSREARHEIFRARIAGSEGSVETLDVRSGGSTEQVPIARIKTLTFARDQVDAGGFMNATLVRSDDGKETAAMVQVRSAKSALRLTGFNSEGASVGIDLSLCKRVEFAAGAQDSGGAAAQPQMKK